MSGMSLQMLSVRLKLDPKNYRGSYAAAAVVPIWVNNFKNAVLTGVVVPSDTSRYNLTLAPRTRVVRVPCLRAGSFTENHLARILSNLAGIPKSQKNWLMQL